MNKNLFHTDLTQYCQNNVSTKEIETIHTFLRKHMLDGLASTFKYVLFIPLGCFIVLIGFFLLLKVNIIESLPSLFLILLGFYLFLGITCFLSYIYQMFRVKNIQKIIERNIKVSDTFIFDSEYHDFKDNTTGEYIFKNLENRNIILRIPKHDTRIFCDRKNMKRQASYKLYNLDNIYYIILNCS